MPSPELLRSNICSRCGNEMPDNRRLPQCASCSGIPDEPENNNAPPFITLYSHHANSEVKKQTGHSFKKTSKNKPKGVYWGSGSSK